MRISRNKQILTLISNTGFKDRLRIADSFNLTLSGAKRAVDELIRQGLIKLSGQKAGAKGRPSEFFDFNPEFGLLGAIEVGRIYSKSAIYDFQGNRLHLAEYKSDFSKPPQKHIGKLIAEVKRWAAEYKSPLKAFAMAAGGMIEPESNTIYHLFPGEEWQKVSLDTSAIPEMPFILAPYAACAMAAETNQGVLKDVEETSLFFHFGSNAVASIMMNGIFFSNDNSPYGYIGHQPVPGNLLQCYCGKTGCAETLISADGILGQFKRAIDAGAINQAGDMTLVNLIKAMALGDSLATKVLEDGARTAGQLLAGAVNLLGPKILVLGGQFFFEEQKVAERLLRVIETAIRENGFYRNTERLKIVTSGLGNDSIIAGAAVMARNQWIGANF